MKPVSVVRFDQSIVLAGRDLSTIDSVVNDTQYTIELDPEYRFVRVTNREGISVETPFINVRWLKRPADEAKKAR